MKKRIVVSIPLRVGLALAKTFQEEIDSRYENFYELESWHYVTDSMSIIAVFVHKKSRE